MARQMSPRDPERTPFAIDVESDDGGLHEPVPVRRFRFAPAKVVMAVAVLGVLVLAGVGVQKNYGGGSDLAKVASKPWDIKNVLELDDEAMKQMDPKVMPVMELMQAWGEGLLDGDKCKETFAKFAADDVVFDSRGVSKESGGGKFEGLDGACEFTRNLASFPATYADFKFDAPPYVHGNTVKLHVSYKLKIKKTGKFQERSHDGQWYHINAEGKVDKAFFVFGNPKLTDDLVGEEEPKPNADIQKVVAMTGKWGKGEFIGDGCLDALKGVVTEDIAIDAFVPGMKHSDGFKEYTGHQGCCDWFKFLTKFPFIGFEVTGLHAKSSGEVGLSDKYMLPTADGKNSSYFYDSMLITLEDGLISGMNFNFGNAAAMDAYLGSTAKVLPVMGVMKAWGQGLLNGDKCKETIAKFYADDIVIDARGVSAKAWGGKREGIEGACKFTGQIAKFGDTLSDFKFEAPPYVNGDNVILGISYILKSKKTKKTVDERSFDTQWWHINDEGKVDKWSAVFSNPKVVNDEAGDETPPPNDDAKVVEAMMAKWGEGDFNGEGCLDAAKDVATEDVVVDAFIPGMKHTDGYKKYTGHQGWCDWCKFLLNVKFTDFKVSGFTPKEEGEIGMTVQYMLPLPNGQNSSYYHDGILFQIKGGLISSMMPGFGQPAGLDMYFAQNQ